MKHPQLRHGLLPSEQLRLEVGAAAPAAVASQERGGRPPQSVGTSFCAQHRPPPSPSSFQGTGGPGAGGGLVIPSPFFSSPCCPLEPVPLRVNLLARQGVTGGVCHWEPRPSALLANWGAGAGSTGNGRREGAGMREGRLPSPPSRQAWG